jgi:hypothetical protein
LRTDDQDEPGDSFPQARCIWAVNTASAETGDVPIYTVPVTRVFEESLSWN